MTMRASIALLFAVILVGRNEAASLGGEIGPSTRYIPGRAIASLLHEAQINNRCGDGHMLCLPISQFESDRKLYGPEVLATTAGTSFNERPPIGVEGTSDFQMIAPPLTINVPRIGEKVGSEISKTTLTAEPKSTPKKTDEDLIVNDSGVNAVKESSPGTNNGGSSSLSSSLGSKLSGRTEADIGNSDLPILRDFNRWLTEHLKNLDGKSRNDDISSSKRTSTLANSSHSDGSLPVDSTQEDSDDSTAPLVQSSDITFAPGEPDSTVKKPEIQGAGGSIIYQQSLPISGDFTEDNVPSNGAQLRRTETTQQLSSKSTKDTQSPHAKAAKDSDVKASNVDANLPAYLVDSSQSDLRTIASNTQDDKDSTVKASAKDVASADSSILPVTAKFVGESTVKDLTQSTPESHSQTYEANVNLTTTPIFKIATPTLYSSTSSEDIAYSAQSTPLLPSSPSAVHSTSVLSKKQQSIKPTNVLSITASDEITSVPSQSLALSSNKISTAGQKSNEDKTVGERIVQKTTKSTQTPTISVPSISYGTGNDYLIQFVPIIHSKDTRQPLFCPSQPISPHYVYTLTGNNTINNHQPITHCQ